MSVSAAAEVPLVLQDFSKVYHDRFAYQPSDSSSDITVNEDTIASYADKFENSNEERSFGNELLRQDSLSEIHNGLNTLGTIIKIVTGVMSLFGSESLDR